MRMEADRWRLGLRSGEVRCLCREIAKQNRRITLDEFQHIHDHRARCLWDYGVHRVYEIERQLEGLRCLENE